ncbi:MAG: hypothetical protein AAF960_09155 [Bacteroidota bacterium]
MKKTLLNLSLFFVLIFATSSCYTYTHVVGSGAQTGLEITEKITI